MGWEVWWEAWKGRELEGSRLWDGRDGCRYEEEGGIEEGRKEKGVKVEEVDGRGKRG